MVDAMATALIAGVDLGQYMALPSWQRSIWDLAIIRTIEMRTRMKESEVQAMGASVGNAVGKLFK